MGHSNLYTDKFQYRLYFWNFILLWQPYNRNIDKTGPSINDKNPLTLLYTMILSKIPDAQGYYMFTDQYYTSYILINELHKLKCHLTGTILTNRKKLSTVEGNNNVRHSVQTVVRKTNAVINYTKFMGGVDLADHYCSTYCFTRKSLK